MCTADNALFQETSVIFDTNIAWWGETVQFVTTCDVERTPLGKDVRPRHG